MIHIYICTKDRPQSLRALLSDLASVLDGDHSNSRTYIFDDSWETGNQTIGRAISATSELKATYVGRAERAEILSNLPWPSLRARQYADYAFRVAPTRGWDLAGVRAIAHLCAASLPPSERTLFLDDDIRLRSASYNSDSFHVDTTTVREALRHRGADGSLIGATYVGRADVALSEHLAQALGEIGCGVFDAYSGTDQTHWHGEPGISGAFLLTTSRTIASIPVPRCYNEDWVVITLATFLGTGIARMATPVLHAGGPQAAWDPSVAVAQQIGQVVFRSIFEAASQVGVSNLGELENAALQQVADESRSEVDAWGVVRGKWPRLDLNPVADIRGLIGASNQALRDYFKVWPGWFDLVQSSEARRFLTSYFEASRRSRS